MRKLLPFCVLLLFYRTGFSQTLFTYGKQSVSVREYTEFVSDNALNPKNKRANLDLFAHYLLKLQAARDAGLDTAAHFLADVAAYASALKSQITHDEPTLDSLTREAMNRAQHDVEIRAWIVGSETSRSADSAVAQALLQQLTEGKFDRASFEKAYGRTVQEVYGGFMTAFTVPYDLESLIYYAKPGDYVGPLHAGDHWLVLQKLSQRKAAGKITIEQIFFPAGEKAANADSVRRLAQQVYEKLVGGASFAELARVHSAQSHAYGKEPSFYTGTYTPTFESRAFALEHDGQISSPFVTNYGYHILKRVALTPVPDTNDHGFFLRMREQVLNSSRGEIARAALVQRAIGQTNPRFQSFDTADLWMITDSALLSKRVIEAGRMSGSSALIRFRKGSSRTVNDWIEYAESHIGRRNQLHTQYKTLLQDFFADVAVSQYVARAGELNDTFQKKLKQYKEGSLVFEIMEREVWQPAADETRQRAFFARNATRYPWNRSAQATVFTCESELVCAQIRQSLLEKQPWTHIVEGNSPSVTVDSGRMELSALSYLTELQPGISPVVQSPQGWRVTHITKVFQAGAPKAFEEAREQIHEDLTRHLEAKFLEKQHEKYPVLIDQDVLNTL